MRAGDKAPLIQRFEFGAMEHERPELWDGLVFGKKTGLLANRLTRAVALPAAAGSATLLLHQGRRGQDNTYKLAEREPVQPALARCELALRFFRPIWSAASLLPRKSAGFCAGQACAGFFRLVFSNKANIICHKAHRSEAYKSEARR